MPIRIYALSKELQVENRFLFDLCHCLGMKGVNGIQSVFSALTDEEAVALRVYVTEHGKELPAGTPRPSSDVAPPSLRVGSPGRPLPALARPVPVIEPVKNAPSPAALAPPPAAPAPVSPSQPAPAPAPPATPATIPPKESRSGKTGFRPKRRRPQFERSGRRLGAGSPLPLVLTKPELGDQVLALSGLLEFLLKDQLAEAGKDDDVRFRWLLDEFCDNQPLIVSVNRSALEQAWRVRCELAHPEPGRRPSETGVRRARNDLLLALLDLVPCLTDELRDALFGFEDAT